MEAVHIGNIKIPIIQGETGPQGLAGKIKEVRIKKLDILAEPTVENLGTENEAIIEIGIPQNDNLNNAKVNDKGNLILILDSTREIDVGTVVGKGIANIIIEKGILRFELTDGSVINAGSVYDDEITNEQINKIITSANEKLQEIDTNSQEIDTKYNTYIEDMNSVESNVSNIQTNVEQIQENIINSETNIERIEEEFNNSKEQLLEEAQQLIDTSIDENTKIFYWDGNDTKRNKKNLELWQKIYDIYIETNRAVQVISGTTQSPALFSVVFNTTKAKYTFKTSQIPEFTFSKTNGVGIRFIYNKFEVSVSNGKITEVSGLGDVTEDSFLPLGFLPSRTSANYKATDYNPTESYQPTTKRYVDTEIEKSKNVFFIQNTTASKQADLKVLNKAYQKHLNGEDVLIVTKYENYPVSFYYSSTNTSDVMNVLLKTDTTVINSSYSNIENVILTFSLTISSSEVTNFNILINSSQGVDPYLSTNKNYTVPYSPKYDGSPATKKYVDDNVKALSSAKLTRQIVEELPETGENNIIYLVPNHEDNESNIFDEYMYINGKYEPIGTTKVDLSNYVAFNDYASYMNAGVIKTNQDSAGTYVQDDGMLMAHTVETYEEYLGKNEDSFISKGTLTAILSAYVKEGVVKNTIELTDEEKQVAQNWLGVSDLVGNINEILDNINGEVI